MRIVSRLCVACCIAALSALSVQAAPSADPQSASSSDTSSRAVSSPAAAQWLADVAAIASDANEGRLTGSAGYRRAADYVVKRLKAEGLHPAGVNGYEQDVAFEQQVVDQAASAVALYGPDGVRHTLQPGEDILIASGTGPRPATVDAPLLFIGYGLHLPKQGYDDFAGQDLKGKIVIVVSGGPAEISGAVKSNARFQRLAQLYKRGVRGIITLTTPKQIEIPWARQKQNSGLPGMYLADPALRDVDDALFLASMDPQAAERLFTGSGHSFAELAALADAGKPLPHFALPLHLSATVAAVRTPLRSPNIIAKLPGRDAKLSKEYVILSAHLDHLGMAKSADGKPRIFSGAMDDASGVATVLDIAHRLKSGPRPRRSILFVFFTAEEKGLLGSRYFSLRPTVAKKQIVADLNFDMALPLWPLKTIYAPGQDESTLGKDARVVAEAMGYAMVPDPMPERNVFTRTDQFSFVRQGIPALAFKFGFAKNTPEAKIEHDWRANRYHAIEDNLDQPFLVGEAIKLDDFVAALTIRVANASARPAWDSASIFAP